MRNNKFQILIIVLSFNFINCADNKKKTFEDYNEEDFIEVQGLIINAEKEFSYQYREVDVVYIYDLEKEKPTVVFEKNTPFIPMIGSPVIILVHKYEDGVTFLGGIGYVENEGGLVEQYLDKSEKSGVRFYGVD